MKLFTGSIGAFPCQTKQGCPTAALKPGTTGFCPAWQETSITEENLATGQSRFMRGCYFDVQLRAMEYVIKASNRPAAEIGAIRAEVAKSVENAVAGFFARLDPEMVAAALAAQEIGNENSRLGTSRFRLQLPANANPASGTNIVAKGNGAAGATTVPKSG